MSVSTIKSIVKRFLTNGEAEVLSINGNWGVGKTFFWNKVLKEFASESSLQNYAYVSLFGISSLRELKASIFVKRQTLKLFGVPIDANKLNIYWKDMLVSKFKSLANIGSQGLKEHAIGKNLTVSLETLAPHLISQTLICLDDFERLDAKKISQEEILGFISELKEEKSCKIVLIFNQSKLQSTDIFERYREKVIDVEIQYSPTVGEAMDIALPDNLFGRSIVVEKCEYFSITNIRVLRKIVHYVDLVSHPIKEMHGGVAEKCISAIVLLCWCYFERNEDKPDVNYLISSKSFFDGFSQSEDHDSKKTKWNSLLVSYGIYYADSMLVTLVSVIKNGFLEGSGFVTTAEAYSRELEASDLNQTLSSAWNLFHNNLHKTEQEIVDSFRNAVEVTVQHLRIAELNAVVNLHRELNRNNEADELIDYFLKHRGHEVETLKVDSGDFLGSAADAALLKKFEEKLLATKPSIPFSDAMKNLGTSNHFSTEVLDALRVAPADDFHTYFKNCNDRDLHRRIQACLSFGSDTKYSVITQNARSALTRLAAESAINAVRLRPFGIGSEHKQ